MKAIERLIRILAFDVPDKRFELRERESGEPDAFGGWNEPAPGRSKSRQGFIMPKRANGKLDKIEADLRRAFNAEVNGDIVFRKINTGSGHRALIVYMSGMADEKTIADFVISPLIKTCDADPFGGSAVFAAKVEYDTDPAKINKAVLDGMCAVFTENRRDVLIADTTGYEKRSVEQPQNERIVLGPKESFNESIKTNASLLRRIIRTEDLIVEYIKGGGENRTGFAVVYRKGNTNEALIKEVKSRIAKVKEKYIETTGVLEQLIEDDRLFPIPQALSTERPDRTASFIMQGACAILADGSPFALIVPATFSALMSSPEDVYLRKPLGSILRSIRYAGAFISIILPAYFIAMAMYHQGLLSTEVLSTVIKSREMVFEPLPFEMLLLLFVFQLIREAGMRVPGSVGQAIGVIGGLILGQAAVAANLASTVILIIVALSGLGNLCIPDYSTQIAASYFRMGFVIAAWMAGLVGLTSAFLLFIGYLAYIKSFGVPFLAPFAPKTQTKRPFISRGIIGRHLRAEDYLNTADDSAI